MLTCKTSKNFNYHGLNSQRAMANNSVVLLRDTATKQMFKEVMSLNKSSFGEPGFMFTNNLNHGMNPCGEIGIDPTIEDKTGFGFCNLSEINVSACYTPEEFYDAARAAAFIATLQASYTNFPYLGKISEEIAKRDSLIGVGLVGVMDKPEISLNKKILSSAAKVVVEENIRVAKLIGINPAKRTTTIKPSGTSSLELGCVGSGIGLHHAKRYFRRVTANKNEPIARFFKQHNPHMVSEKPNGDWCITFPVKAKEGACCLGDITASQYIDIILSVYDNWILSGDLGDGKLTHNISATIVFEDWEWEKIMEQVWENRKGIRAMSFFPKTGDKGIPFVPREEVTNNEEEIWKNLIENYVPIDYSNCVETHDVTNHTADPACIGGTCDIVHVQHNKTLGNGEAFYNDSPFCTVYPDDLVQVIIGNMKINKIKWG